MRAACHVLVGTDCLQGALTVLPNEDAGAKGAQLCLPLVYAYTPSAAAQRDRGGQPGEACSGYLGVHYHRIASNRRVGTTPTPLHHCS